MQKSCGAWHVPSLNEMGLSVLVSTIPEPPKPPNPKKMADDRQTARGILTRLQQRSPSSTQMIGAVTLAVAGAILVFLTGVTLTGTVIGLVVVSPVLLALSPVLVPVGLAVAVALTASGFGVAAISAGSWVYKYVKGRHPPGSQQFDYARSRIADTASHVKDYAREYGGYLHSKVQDVAPSA